MFNKMVMFAASIASRGFKNKKIDLQTKQLRVLSCFGGGDVKTHCPYLSESVVDKTKHFCAKCGCGDKSTTWLVKDGNEYSKLDYPVLNCPMKMPGFTNYDPNFYNNEIKQRKQEIENFDPNNLNLIKVTIGTSEEKEKLMEDINKVIENT